MKRNWKEALALMGIKPRNATMTFEIDDANGEKLIFPEANDITEIKVDSAVTATDGEHIFIADNKTYKITVSSGKISALEEVVTDNTPVDTQPVMSAETVEMFQAFANEFEEKDLSITEMKSEIETLKTTLSEMKALMSHGKDDKKEVEEKKQIIVNGKTIDLTKVNFK